MTAVRREASWSDASHTPYPALAQSPAADVAVIGGGLAGVMTAYLLAREGKTVVLLEKDRLGSGATGLTTAMLTASIDTDATDLIKAFGKADARLLIKAHQDAVDLIEKIVTEEGIDCDFHRAPNVIYANDEDDFKGIKEEYDALRSLDTGIGFSLSEDGSDLGFHNAGHMEFEDQALFHPLKFLYALAEIAVKKYGVQIYEGTEVQRIERIAGRMNLKAGKYAVTAEWAVSATYEPFDEPVTLFFKKGMYITYMFELFVEGRTLREGSYEDTNNPYHFGRIEKEDAGYRFIIGGEDHRKDLHVDENKNWNALKEYVDSILPPDSYVIRRKWKGPILEPVDGVPLIGPLNDDPILYISAFSGNGMTYSGIAAQVITDHIRGEENPLERLYTPERTLHVKAFLRKAVDYAEEIGGGAIKNAFTESKEPDPKTVKGTD